MSVNVGSALSLQECTVLGLNGFPFSIGEKISLAFEADAVRCLGKNRSADFSYTELAELKISGPGTVTSGGGFIGGGFGVEGALEGMAIAGVLNLLTTRNKIHTFITLIANFGELHLHYGEMEPAALRMALAPVYVKLRRLDPTWLQSRLQILESEQEIGRLTEDAMKAARQRLLVASEWNDPDVEARNLKLLREADSKAAMEIGPRGACPNCDTVIALHAESCPKCKAAFGVGSTWIVRPI